MIKVFLFDLSRTLLFPVDDKYKGTLNQLHNNLSVNSDYNFWKHFRLDEDIMSYLQRIKDKYKLCIFTSGTIQNASELKHRLDEIFKKVYSAEIIGLSKKFPESYEFIAKDLGCTPDEILYYDDSEENIRAAKDAKINAVLFKDFDKLRQDLRKYLSSN